MSSDTTYIVRCPPIVDYPPEVQAKAGDEIEAMPEGSVLPGFIADYGLLRRQCRTIGKKMPLSDNPGQFRSSA